LAIGQSPVGVAGVERVERVEHGVERVEHGVERVEHGVEHLIGAKPRPSTRPAV
jgi:hypothetical protein